MDDRRLKLSDVAREAGVSTATVSRCLNGSDAVSAATRARVMEVVDRLGYIPDLGARALATRRSRTVGAVVPTLENSIFARGLQAFQQELSRLDATLLLASSDYDAAEEARQIEALVARGVGGLLLIGTARWGPSATVRLWKASGLVPWPSICRRSKAKTSRLICPTTAKTGSPVSPWAVTPTSGRWM